MSTLRRIAVLAVPVAALLASGCASPTIDFSDIERPPRAAELDAYNAFVGKWIWGAEIVNAEGANKEWTGEATWKWALDERCLRGDISARSSDASFDASGIWSWHPTNKKYIWWMFNNWGYPQEGTASYDAETKCWSMNYKSVGLDGTPSYGRYTMKFVSDDLLEWDLTEWADAMHMFPKLEMKGTYKRIG